MRPEDTMPTDQTEATLRNHLHAFFHKNIDGVVADYAEEAVLIVQRGPLHGIAEIRTFFARFVENMPAGFLDAFKLRRQEVVGEMGYIVWDAGPWVQFATDTFVVRDGKIRSQTFAAYPAPQ
ncbi:MAG TPA: nuclear transport factor 2 family protein [Kofleriaceae bacterium]|jgi:ketosteroid isomerase-like protein